MRAYGAKATKPFRHRLSNKRCKKNWKIRNPLANVFSPWLICLLRNVVNSLTNVMDLSGTIAVIANRCLSFLILVLFRWFLLLDDHVENRNTKIFNFVAWNEAILCQASNQTQLWKYDSVSLLLPVRMGDLKSDKWNDICAMCVRNRKKWNWGWRVSVFKLDSREKQLEIWQINLSKWLNWHDWVDNVGPPQHKNNQHGTAERIKFTFIVPPVPPCMAGCTHHNISISCSELCNGNADLQNSPKFKFARMGIGRVLVCMCVCMCERSSSS